MDIFDSTDKSIFAALDEDPRKPILFLARDLGLARGTVQSRLERKLDGDCLQPHTTRIFPEALGFPLLALITAEVEQSSLEEAVRALSEIPEVLEVQGMAGEADLLLRVVARDTDDLFRVGRAITDSPGIRRTMTSLLLKSLIPYRVFQLLQ